MARALTSEERAKIIELYDAGLQSPKELATEVGRDRQVVREVLAAADRIPHRRPKIDDDLMDAVAASYQAGRSLRECGQTHHIGWGTARAIVLFKGVPLRPRGVRRSSAHEVRS